MAETTREMVVRLTMDAGGFKKTAAEIKTQIKNIDSEIKSMGADDKGKKSKLEEKLGLQKTAVENLEKAVKNAKAALTNADTEAKKLIEAKRVSNLETDLVNAKLKAEALQRQISAANLIKFGTLATNFGKSMRTMGRTMSMYISGPLAALGGKAYKTALDFESATVSMQKTVDETDSTTYEDIAAAFKEMSENGPTSFTELMELAGMAGAFGVGADDIVKFVESVSMLSVTADDIDAASGAEGLTKLLNITQQGDYSNIQRVASALTELGNRTNATEGEILIMATRMASTGELAGLSTEGILALAAGFTSVGIEAEAGGTAAGKVMKMMTSAALSDEDNVFSKIMGISGKDFASGWRSDAASSMISFFQSLSELDANKDFGAIQWLEENGLTEIRLSNLIAAAATNPKLFENALATSKEAYDLNTALTDEAEKRYNTAESYQSTQFNRMENASADVGENLVDPIQNIMTKVADLLEKFSALDEGTQNWILGIGGGLVVGGPALVGLGKVFETIGGIATHFGSAKAATSSWQAMMSNKSLWGLAAGGALLMLYELMKFSANTLTSAYSDPNAEAVAALDKVPEQITALQDARAQIYAALKDPAATSLDSDKKMSLLSPF
ncbi:MAG: phage tail tape measure protein [Christensenellales bacterium]